MIAKPQIKKENKNFTK